MPYDCHLFGPETAEAAPVEAPTVRSAILLAADHIEQHPELFRFTKCRIPECGTPGCLLGWIGHFLGMAPGQSILGLESPMNADHHLFYDRVSSLLDQQPWTVNAPMCARGLRLYANTYHKEPVHAL